MKTMIKFAAISAVALAASSTAALALPELPAGTTTGLALGAPLPEGVYDISIASYGSSKGGLGNLSYAIPVWLIWSTPYQIAGGRIALDTATAVADVGEFRLATAIDSFLNTLVEGSIAWNLGNGWNASLRAGAWLPSTQALPTLLSRDYTAFQGGGSVSYVANGWNLTATALYGSGHDGQTGSLLQLRHRPEFVGKPGPDRDQEVRQDGNRRHCLRYVGYGLSESFTPGCMQTKASEFAIGGLVGYDFGSFIAQAKLAGDVRG